MDNGNEQTGADECHHDRADQADGLGREQTHDDPTDEGADQADDDIAETPVATTAHHLTGEPPGNEADYDPADDAAWRQRYQNNRFHPRTPFVESLALALSLARAS